MQVGFIGLGRMGSPIARSLVEAGHRVVAFNRTASRTEDLVALGACAAPSAGDAAAGADAVLTMLADDAAVEGVVLGTGGVLDRMSRDSVHVSMSTIGVALADRLAAAHAARGQHFVAAPVFGRPEAAASRSLTIVASGNAGAVERCLPLFESVGRRTFHVGDDASHAIVVKLMGNFLLASMLEGLGESSAVARRYGLDPQAFIDVLTEALFPCAIFRSYGTRIASGQHTPAGLSLVLGLKDVMLAAAAAERVAVAMPIADVVEERARAGIARGMGDWDWSALALLSEALA